MHNLFFYFEKISNLIFTILFNFFSKRFFFKDENRKIYYILYESFARDFLPRLLIVIKLAIKKNHVVFISIREFFRYLEFLPNGIVLNKGITTNISIYNKLLLKKKFKQCVLDEEQLALKTSNDLLSKTRVDERSIKAVDRFYCWGKNQKEAIIRKYPEIKKKAVITGSPKFDFLTNKKLNSINNVEIKEIKKNYKKFILFPSNFGISTYTPYQAKKLIIKTKNEFKINDKKFINDYESFIKYKKCSLNEFINMIKEINRSFKDINLIIRPHPNDDHDFWKKNLPISKSIHLEYKYSIHPWIQASLLTIHNHCTTSVESFFLKKPSICFSPISTNSSMQSLSFKTSYDATSINQVKNLIQKILKKKNRKIFKSLDFKNSISNSEKFLASNRVCNDLNKINIEKNHILNNLISIKFANSLSNLFFGFLKQFRKKYKNHYRKTRIDFNFNKKFKMIENLILKRNFLKLFKISNECFLIKIK
jgi:surface carbohydrate biosynthesis protein